MQLPERIAFQETNEVDKCKSGTTLFAIGEIKSKDSFALVKFMSDRTEDSKFVESLEGDEYSKTIFFKGMIFVIGGGKGDLGIRVSTFDVISGEKRQAANIQIRRNAGHSIATSPDHIFVCGGLEEEEKKTCEAFHPQTNRWISLPDLQQGRFRLALAYFPDGRLLATGGWGFYETLASCEMLNSALVSETWRPVAAMRQARQCHAAVCFEGRILVAGGCGLTSCEVFSSPPLPHSTNEVGQWTSLLSSMTRMFNNVTSLLLVSANDILAFGDEGQVERLQKNPISSPEEGNFEAWSWSPLPAIGHLESVYGVHLAN